jgi:hypothetical protein
MEQFLMCKAKQIRKLKKAMLRAFFSLPDCTLRLSRIAQAVGQAGTSARLRLRRIRVKLPISDF